MPQEKKIFSSKSFYGSILFAIALWGYSSLNSDFIINIELPLTVKLPPNRAIENNLPPTVSVEVRGTGWHLFNLLYLNSSKICNIDLSKSTFTDDIYVISRNEILKGIQYLVNVEPREVLTDVLELSTGQVGTYKVKVDPVVTVKPLDGLIVVGDVICSPDSIRIHGNDRIVRNITRWLTQSIDFPNVHKSFTASVQLSDSLSGKVELSQNYVGISVEVQQIAEVTYDDIPIKIRGGTAPQNHIFAPMLLRVTVQGGAEQLESLTPEDISASIDYTQIISDSTGILIPEVKAPAGYTLMKFEPPYIYHFEQKKGSKLTENVEIIRKQ